MSMYLSIDALIDEAASFDVEQYNMYWPEYNGTRDIGPGLVRHYIDHHISREPEIEVEQPWVSSVPVRVPWLHHRISTIVERATSTYSWQLGYWKSLKARDRAKPAFDPSKVAPDSDVSGIRKDGSIKKFTASMNYFNWPVNRLSSSNDAPSRLSHDDIDMDSPEYWERVLESEGMGHEPSSEFEGSANAEYVEHVDQSMTGFVCDQLMLQASRKSPLQSLQEQYQIWLAAYKRARYANDLELLLKTTTKGTTRKGRVKGKNKFEELRAAGRAAKASLGK